MKSFPVERYQSDRPTFRPAGAILERIFLSIGYVGFMCPTTRGTAEMRSRDQQS